MGLFQGRRFFIEREPRANSFRLVFLSVTFSRGLSFSRKPFARGGVRHRWRSFARGFQKSGRDFEYEPDRLGITAIDFGDIRAFQ